MNKIVKNICVDAGIIMVADHDYFEERNPEYQIEERLNKQIDVPVGTYQVNWRIPKTWNGNVSGEGVLEVSSGKVVITDPCYILGHVESNPRSWDEWLDETDFAKIVPKGTIIMNSMGGDGEYNVHLSLEKI